MIWPLASLLLATRLAAQQRDTLQRDTIVLRPVVVTSTILPTAAPKIGSGVPAQIAEVQSRDIEAWEPRTLANALASQPGVSVYDDLGSPLKMSLTSRGFAVGPALGLPQGVSVFLDGVRENEPDAAQVNFDLLPLEHVERIEFLQGPAALLGPNSLGGAINLVTKRGGGRLASEIDLDAGSFGELTGEGSVSGSLGRWDFYLGGGVETDRGWRADTHGRQRNLFLNLGQLRPDRGISIQVFGAGSRAKEAGSLPESLFVAAPRLNFTPGDFDDLTLWQVSASGYRPLAGGRASVTLYHRRNDSERFNVNQAPQPAVHNLSATRTVGATLEWGWTTRVGGRPLALRAGADGAAHRIRVDLYDRAGGGSDSLTTSVESPSWDLAGYGVADLDLGRVSLSAGLRYDHIHIPDHNRLDPSADTTNTFRHLSARGGVSYDLGRGASLYASLGQSFRAPSLVELACADPTAPCPLPFALGDDPPLNSVIATTAETGAHWAIGTVRLEFSLYRTAVHDDIFFVAPSATQGYFANIAATRRAGGELRLERNFGPRVLLRLGYAYTDATFQTEGLVATARPSADTVRPGDHLPLTPTHRATFTGTWLVTRTVQLDLTTRYTGRQYLRGDEANETPRLPDYAVADLRLRWRAGPWDIAVIVSNLFDRRYANFGTYGANVSAGGRIDRFLTPGAPRALKLLLKWSLDRG